MVENEELFTQNFCAELEQYGVKVLTQDEMWEIFDRQARCRANMSGKEFIRAWDEGEFDDDPERVMFVAMMIDVVRKPS